MRRVLIFAAALALHCFAQAAPVQVLFVGNSYTFGRLDPVLTYNAANVTDLTRPQGPLRTDNLGAPFTNVTNTNSYPASGPLNPTGMQPSYSPHTQTTSWGGVPGIFKQLTVQAGLDYDVSLSTRNAASLRGHFLNAANPNWDLRGNIDNKAWDKVVLQEQSDEALKPKTVGSSTLGSNFPRFLANANLIENWIHLGTVPTYGVSQSGVPAGITRYRERAMNNAIFGSQANCVAEGGTADTCDNNTARDIPNNPNANAAAQIYLTQPWARPNLINPPGTNTIDPVTGNAIYDTSTPAPSFFGSLEEITDENTAQYLRALDFADDDSAGFTGGLVPVGQAFMNAVAFGLATRDMYGPDAVTDGLLDLWFNDGTHASVLGSYLSALIHFGKLTGLDPMMFGRDEIAARDLGIGSHEAMVLQRVASYSLGFTSTIPEPATWALFGLSLLMLMLGRRRVVARPT
jgi:hypothetical protein